jgi:hypothetical protein
MSRWPSRGQGHVIVGSAPAGVKGSVQALIDQYVDNGGKEPVDDASTAVQDQSENVIIPSVHDRCGITVTHGDF